MNDPSCQALEPAGFLKLRDHSALSFSRHLIPEDAQVSRTDATTVVNSQHIIMAFNLRENPHAFQDTETLELLMKIFPGAVAVHYGGTVLTFVLKQLPPKPWPKMVAGLPCYLVAEYDDPDPFPGLFAERSRIKVKLMEHIDGRSKSADNNPTLLEQNIKHLFLYLKNLNIEIYEIQDWINFLVVVLKDDKQNKDYIPQTFMRLPCYILRHNNIFPATGSGLTSLGLRPGIWPENDVDMNNPFLNFCEGTKICSVYQAVKSKDKQEWVRTGHWVWKGQETSDVMVNGVSLTPMVDEKDCSIGLFRVVGGSALHNLCYSIGALKFSA